MAYKVFVNVDYISRSRSEKTAKLAGLAWFLKMLAKHGVDLLDVEQE
jgi:hypothetical protein